MEQRDVTERGGERFRRGRGGGGAPQRQRDKNVERASKNEFQGCANRCKRGNRAPASFQYLY